MYKVFVIFNEAELPVFVGVTSQSLIQRLSNIRTMARFDMKKKANKDRKISNEVNPIHTFMLEHPEPKVSVMMTTDDAQEAAQFRIQLIADYKAAGFPMLHIRDKFISYKTPDLNSKNQQDRIRSDARRKKLGIDESQKLPIGSISNKERAL